MVLDWLRAGDIHLSGLVLLAPHLTETNHQELLNKARHRSKRDIERLVAEHFPKPDVPERIRKLPMPRVPQKASSTSTSTSTSTSASEPRFALTPAAAQKPSKVEPLAKARYKVEFTASQKLRDDIETAKALLGPQGQGLEGMFEEAMALFVEDLKKKKYAKTPRPRRTKSKSNDQADDAKRSRHIPNQVKREVAERDNYQCAFVDEEGNRCQERWGLELHHHEVAFARGGAHTTDNVQLMCRPHNRYLAEREFGTATIEDKIQMRQSIPRGPGNVDAGQ